MAQVVDIIRETKSLDNQPPLEYEEILVQARDWQDFLEKVIPLERLTEAFDKAVKIHKTSFPVSAFDIKHGYEQILIEENAKRVEKIRREKEKDPVQFCKYRNYHINEEGEIKIFNPWIINVEDLTVPCPFCRRKAHDEQWKLLYAKYNKKTSLKIVPRDEKA